MNAWEAALAYVVGPALATVGAVLAARYAAKGSVAAADRTAEVSEDANVTDAYHKLVNDLQSDVRRIREDHETLRSAHNALEKKIGDLQRQAARDKDLIRRLVGRLRAAIAEIQRLGGQVPPDSDQDLERVALILDE